jgi:hypothetical protein
MKEQGLHVKYNVTKVDTGELVGNCFVLRPDKDEVAIKSIEAYVAAIQNTELAYDILEWIRTIKYPG